MNINSGTSLSNSPLSNINVGLQARCAGDGVRPGLGGSATDCGLGSVNLGVSRIEQERHGFPRGREHDIGKRVIRCESVTARRKESRIEDEFDGLAKTTMKPKWRSVSQANTTIFVDYLPKQIHSQWLARAFEQCGSVLETRIPYRRRAKTNSRYGFVRFSSEQAMNEAIYKFDGVWWFNKRISVRMARHGRSASAKKIGTKNRGAEANSSVATYMSPKQQIKRVVVDSKDINQEWIKLCAVGIIKGLVVSDHIQKKMVSDGVNGIKVTPLGGLKALLQFNSPEDKEKFMVHERTWLEQWFETVYECSPRESNTYRRTWLQILGVPLHAWCDDTFINLGDLWGTTIEVDHLTSSRDMLEYGRIQILTESLKTIYKSCELKVGNVIYPISCIEVSPKDLRFNNNPSMVRVNSSEPNVNPLSTGKGVINAVEDNTSQEVLMKEKTDLVDDVANLSQVDESPLDPTCVTSNGLIEVAVEIDRGIDVNLNLEDLNTCTIAPISSPGAKEILDEPQHIQNQENIQDGRQNSSVKTHRIGRANTVMGCRAKSILNPISNSNFLHQKETQVGKGQSGASGRSQPNDKGTKGATKGKSEARSKQKYIKPKKLPRPVKQCITETGNQSSLSSPDIRNRNSIMWKEAEMVLETGKLMGLNFGDDDEVAVNNIIAMNANNDNLL